MLEVICLTQLLSGVLRGYEEKIVFCIPICCSHVCSVFVQVFMLPIINYAGGGDKALGIEITMTCWQL